MRIQFELSERDVQHLRRMMRKASAAARKKPRAAILGAASVMAEEVRKFSPPAYVLERTAWLETLIEMLEDEAWRVPQRVERQILDSLAYFANPNDLIPDPIPGLGFLDDAILIELVCRELRDEIEGYRAFQKTSRRLARRKKPLGEGELEARLSEARRRVRSWIQERTAREREKAAAKKAGTRRIW